MSIQPHDALNAHLGMPCEVARRIRQRIDEEAAIEVAAGILASRVDGETNEDRASLALAALALTEVQP